MSCSIKVYKTNTSTRKNNIKHIQKHFILLDFLLIICLAQKMSLMRAVGITKKSIIVISMNNERQIVCDVSKSKASKTSYKNIISISMHSAKITEKIYLLSLTYEGS